MKRLKPILFLLFANLLILSKINASSIRVNPSPDVLKKEVTKLIQNKMRLYENFSEQDVTIGFMINAKNELIILDVMGDSTSACEYVKQVLNYNKVKYQQARQLTRYSIKIRLMKPK
ncbi:MAG: hypothetical protein ABIQ02_15965 [Saprospiraceae bacterium]